MHRSAAVIILVFLQIVSLQAMSGDLQQQYIGCFNDNSSNRVMGTPYTDTLTTVDRCWQKCKLSSSSFFGVEYWYECYCADAFDTLGPADNCSARCGGNLTQTCGGEGALSVYSVCPKGRYRQNCTGVCNCRNATSFGENCFRNGTCPTGCKDGWTGTHCATDIDECSTNNGNCFHNCTNTRGNYRCSCRSGFNLEMDAHNCTDIDECAAENGNCSHGCNNTPGSYNCFCWPGYRMMADGKTCQDIDECNYTMNGNCSHNCTNTEGSYRCSCPNGFNLSVDAHSCTDIDECAVNNGSCSQGCNNTAGSYNCYCRPGYRITEYGTTCQDVNECAENSSGCMQGCNNTIGSYYCYCMDGFTLANDSRDCTDFNECEIDKGGCQHECNNYPGNYSCSCRHGYEEINATHCKDIDECQIAKDNCSHQCENTDGGYVCRCHDGFQLDHDNMTCKDINECMYNKGNCSQVCNNTEGSFNCSCLSGYLLDDDGTSCNDIDECSEPSICHHNCTNMIGSYACLCDSGYKLNTTDNKTCDDVDECADRNGGCEHNCSNSVGNFSCACRQGYLLVNETRCQDINECEVNNGGCEHTCNNTDGSHHCTCKNGFTLDDNDRNCTDIDECQHNNGGCQQVCNNTDGNFTCQCDIGFSLDTDGTNCSDINECERDNGGCQHNCTNTVGSFQCGCAANYTLHSDGRKCDDIDECKENNGGCEQTCFNLAGSFECLCDKLNRRNESGYILNDDQRTCSNVNECETNTSRCEHICTDTDGDYECSCHPGYKQSSDDYHLCTDINECDTNNGDCDQECSNSPGSYECSCYRLNINRGAAYSLNSDGRTCADINECDNDKGGCEHGCINTDGDYECSCRAGYKLVESGDGSISKRCAATGGLIATLILVIILIILVTGFVVYYFRYYRKPARAVPREDGYASTNSHHRRADNGAVAYVPLQNCKAPVEDTPDESQVEVEPIDTSAIYANLTIDISSSAKTRVKVDDLPELVARINRMSDLFKAEFKSMALTSSAKYDFAEKPELKTKNRFKNILPYNDSRVRLSQIGEDPLTTYINASFIQGYREDEKLIASHGPTVSTLNDFWRMIWEYNVGVIVMVTRCVEEMKMKCEQYWPESGDRVFDTIKVVLRSVEERPDHIIRKLEYSMGQGQARLVTHIQFTDWPDHGVPEHAISLLGIRHSVKRLVGFNQYIVVHCSAGVGRTGTFLAIDYLLSQGKCEGFIDVHSHVKKLREQRMNCVQTLDQYTFIFRALLEGLTLGETTLPLSEFCQHISKLHSVNPLSNKTRIETEFQMLQLMNPVPPESACVDALLEANRNKNRDMKLLPMDCRRVYIQHKTKARTDYINAVYVPSFRRKMAYISTQLPLDKTVGDFWNMCVDYGCKVIVFLQRASESANDVFSFLPTAESNTLRFGKTCVSGLSPTTLADDSACQLMTLRTMRGEPNKAADYENIYANAQEVEVVDNGSIVTIVHVSLPADLEAVHDVLVKAHDIVSGLPATTSTSDTPPTVVMSRDGVKHCGQFIALSNLLDMISSQQEIDVFQTVCNIKRAQPHFYTDMAQYESLYSVSKSYSNDDAPIYYNA